MSQNRPSTSRNGFARAGQLLQSRIRKAGEGRGFAQTRLLTHWAEIVGEDIAAMARPVNVSYARGGLGGTLTLLTTGAMAPMLEMQTNTIRDRVNACYGYAAINRVRITQTAPTGFAEGRVSFETRPKAAPQPPEETDTAAREAARGVASDDLRLALERLGTNVLRRQDKT